MGRRTSAHEPPRAVPAWHVQGLRSRASAPGCHLRLPRRGDSRARRGERVREVDIARDREWRSRARRGHCRGRRQGAPSSHSGRCTGAGPRHRVSDVLARPRPDGRAEPLPRRARRPPTGIRAHGGVGGGQARRVPARRPRGRNRGDAVTPATSAARGRQSLATQAEGAPARRADDRARAGGGGTVAHARARAQPLRRRHRLRQPPAA